MQINLDDGKRQVVLYMVCQPLKYAPAEDRPVLPGIRQVQSESSLHSLA